MRRAAGFLAIALPFAASCVSRAPEPATPSTAAVVTGERRNVTRPPEVTDSAIALGRQVFLTRGNCQHCHGPAGRGGALGPDLGDDRWIHGDGSFETLVERVVHGVPAPSNSTTLPMPEREVAGLRYPEIRAVAAYVWSLREHRN